MIFDWLFGGIVQPGTPDGACGFAYRDTQHIRSAHGAGPVGKGRELDAVSLSGLVILKMNRHLYIQRLLGQSWIKFLYRHDKTAN